MWQHYRANGTLGEGTLSSLGCRGSLVILMGTSWLTSIVYVHTIPRFLSFWIRGRTLGPSSSGPPRWFLLPLPLWWSIVPHFPGALGSGTTCLGGFGWTYTCYSEFGTTSLISLITIKGRGLGYPPLAGLVSYPLLCPVSWCF